MRVVTIIDVAGCSLGMFNCPRWHMQHSAPARNSRGTCLGAPWCTTFLGVGVDRGT